MTIRFSCPNCGKALKVQPSGRDRSLKCPFCQRAIHIPAIESQEELIPSQVAEDPNASVHTDAHVRVSALSCIWTGCRYGGLAILVSLGGCIASSGFHRLGNDSAAELILRYGWWSVVFVAGLMALHFLILTLRRSRLLTGMLGLPGVLLIVLSMTTLAWLHVYLYPARPLLSMQSTNPPSEKEAKDASPFQAAQSRLSQLQIRHQKITSLLDKTRGSKSKLILRLQKEGATTTADLKDIPEGTFLLEEFQRLVGEIEELEKAVNQVDEAIVQTEAIIRSYERSQVLGRSGLSDRERKELSTELLTVNESERSHLPVVPVDPVKIDQLLQQELSSVSSSKSQTHDKSVSSVSVRKPEGTSSNSLPLVASSMAEASSSKSTDVNEFQSLRKDFNDLIEATVVLQSKEVNPSNDSVTLHIEVSIHVSQGKYTAFADRLRTILEKEAVEEAEWFGKLRTETYPDSSYLSAPSIEQAVWDWMPNIVDRQRTTIEDGYAHTIYFRPNLVAVGICRKWNSADHSVYGNYYLLESDVAERFLPFVRSQGRGKVEFFDSSDELIAVTTFAPSQRVRHGAYTLSSCPLTLIGMVNQNPYVVGPSTHNASPHAFLFWPIFGAQNTNQIVAAPEITVSTAISVPAEDASKIENVRCGITFMDLAVP